MIPGTVEVEMLGRSLWLVTLTGEHDLATLPIVDEAFQRIDRSETLIVDVRDATFIDSTIIGAILLRQRRHAETLLVVRERGAVRRVLDLVGISSAVQVFESREEALRVIFPPPGYANPELDLSLG